MLKAERNHAYYLRRRDDILARSKQYYRTRKNQVVARTTAYNRSDKKKQWLKKYRVKNAERMATYARSYYLSHREAVLERSKSRYLRVMSDPKLHAIRTEQGRVVNRRHAAKLRSLVLGRYGGQPPHCACCGESGEVFLSLDHINGGGAAHRRAIGPGMLYTWIVKNGFPSGFRILCYNCQIGYARRGTCPHQTERVFK